MARSAIAFAAAVGLVLASCGKEEDKSKSPPQVPYASNPPTNKPPAGGAPTATPPLGSYWTGTVEPAGVGITMQGSHKLVQEGATIAFLTSKTVDLAKYEGKKVRVTGASSTTVEGGKTIVDVQTITEVP